MPGLQDICRERLMKDMVKTKCTNGMDWKVLVVDHTAMRIIGSCCKMHEITEEGVTHVENLDLARQPMPSMEAIYFIAPTVASVQKVAKDFKKKGSPQYVLRARRCCSLLLAAARCCSLLLAAARCCSSCCCCSCRCC